MRRGPVVILEGPDGAGKSTLAERLAIDLGARVVHCGPPDGPEYQYRMRQFLREITPGPTIVDRLHPSAHVYGRAFRGVDDLDPHELWLLEGALASAGAALVYCRPADEVLDHNLERGPDNDDAAIYEDVARRQVIRDMYDEYFRPPLAGVTRLPYAIYAYTRPGDYQALRYDLALRLEQWAVTPMFRPDIPTLGNVRSPRYVFVGDAPHARAKLIQRANRRLLHPAERTRLLATAQRVSTVQTVFDSTSGRYLAAALTATGLSWDAYCVVNSQQLAGEEIRDYVSRAWASRAGADWVALGALADRRLTAAGIPHRTVPHPQYVRRFFYKAGKSRYSSVLLGDMSPADAFDKTDWTTHDGGDS